MEPLYVPFQKLLKKLALPTWDELNDTERVSLLLGSPLTPQKGKRKALRARTMAHAHRKLLRPGCAQILLDPLLPAYNSTGKLERSKAHCNSEQHTSEAPEHDNVPLHILLATLRFPDERTPIEATRLSATPVEFGLGLDLGLGLGSHFASRAPSHAPLLLAPSSHTLSLSPAFTSVCWAD
jgi:hypothetical protein